MSEALTGSRIYPFLWFESNAEEAANFYLSVFPNSRVLKELRSPVDTVGGAAGSSSPSSSSLTG